MKTAEVVALFRGEVADVATPPLWSDTEVLGYLDEAQKSFVRGIGGLSDRTSDITLIAVAVGDTYFDLDPRILKLRGAFRTSDGLPVAVENYTDMAKYGWVFDGRTGPVKAIITGMDEVAVFYYPVVSIADELQLVVDRMPLYTIDSVDVELEVAEPHHRKLVIGMKALAYGKQDAETFDKSKQERFAQEFEAYIFKSKLERGVRTGKARSVQYGGIPMSPRVSRDY